MPWRSKSLLTMASFHLLRLSLSRLRSQTLELTAMSKGVEKCQTLRKFWHLELFCRDLHVIWHFFRADLKKKPPCTSSPYVFYQWSQGQGWPSTCWVQLLRSHQAGQGSRSRVWWGEYAILMNMSNYLIVFRAVYWRWLQLQEMGDRPLPIGLLASGGHLLSDIDEILVLFFIEIQYCWWTFMIFWFSFSFGIAEVNTCCKTNQVALSKLYKSKSEGVKSSFYIYLELPKSPFKRYCIQSVWNKCWVNCMQRTPPVQ